MGEVPTDPKSAPDHVELTQIDHFDRWRSLPFGCIVIWDRVRDAPIAHHPSCPFVSRDHFEEKVVTGGGHNGRYWWAKNSRIAADELEARRCKHGADPLSR